ncbi:MAG TPA: class I SAM-dependent methyltransferase [Acidobacteriota bacterium]|nr:class I SAM-dependent methyltransferase [Acidobacteriota bacterium]
MSGDSKSKADRANGYETFASEFMARRKQSRIGVATVRRWAKTLPRGATVLDLGCGCGMPISGALLEDGFQVYGVDASPSLIQAFRSRFPQAHVACETVAESAFYGREFHGVVAVGLMFLLNAEEQRDLIAKVALALVPGGRFLFSAPVETGTWRDVLTGRQSLSLGAEAYQEAISEAGLSLIAEPVDEGENHYYETQKSCP